MGNEISVEVTRPSRRLKKMIEAATAKAFVESIQYVGGIMSVVLVEEYGWPVEQVEALVEKMQQRIEAERARS